MHVKGLKEGGTPLPDIGLFVPEGKIVDIPLNLSRRSVDLQEAIDAGWVHPAPTKAAQNAQRTAPKPSRIRRPQASPQGVRPPRTPNALQEIAELKRSIGQLNKRVFILEGDNDALKAKVAALDSPAKVTTKKASAKKVTTQKASAKKVTTKKAFETVENTAE